MQDGAYYSLLMLSESINSISMMNNFDNTMSILDEAFYGKKPVIKMDEICCKIADKINENPNYDIQTDSLKSELDKAVADIFGFKRVNIYWSNKYGLGVTGPCTYFGSKLLQVITQKSIKYGTNQKGFYDKKHELTLHIEMYQSLVSRAGLTGPELCGIILHEIGHNFDYSPAAIINMWFSLTMSIFNTKKDSPEIIKYMTSQVVGEYGRDSIMLIKNLDDILARKIPAFNTIRQSVGKSMLKFTKFISSLLTIPTFIFSVPALLIMSPLSYVKNTFMRKGETYADSFSAAYGYGSETITALEKIKMFTTVNNTNNGLMRFMYDLTLCRNELLSVVMGGHGSNQQRVIKMIDKLERDINRESFDPELKKELLDNCNECRTVYNNITFLSEDEYSNFTVKFRSMMDNWFADKPYLIIPPVGDEYQYAE